MPGEDQNREDRTRERSLDQLARGLASGTLSRRQTLKLMGGARKGRSTSRNDGIREGAPALKRTIVAVHY